MIHPICTFFRLCPGMMILLLSFLTVTGQTRVETIKKHLRDPASDYVLVAAHRGDWFWAPENSLAGFKNCIEMGVDMLEIDVRLTKDKVPVVIHDETLERTTTGRGRIEDFTFDEIREFNLKDATGVVTREKVPSLQEVLQLAKGNILVYLDKSKDKIDKLLPLLEKTGTTGQAVFVLDLPYAEAKRQFGSLLEKVIYVPVIEDRIKDLETYIEKFLQTLQPAAFQFRIANEQSVSYHLLDKIVASRSKIFIAATWAHHTAGHDDQVSRTDPDAGWGWLVRKGVSIIETNRPNQLLYFLKKNSLHE